MISPAQREYIGEHAYLPEHVPEYVTAVARDEAFLFDDYLVYASQDRIIFVGYPLKRPFVEGGMKKVFDHAIKRFGAPEVRLIAPGIPSRIDGSDHPAADHYYRLDLSTRSVSPKVRSMLNRAGRDLSVEKSRIFSLEHKKVVEAFLKNHSLEEGTRLIFDRIDQYISSSISAWIFDARRRTGELVAFDIVESGPKRYSLYMFNFRSEALYVPGASDLLLSKVITYSKEEGKKYINLGLGISSGVTFFKRKWGGIPFLPYSQCFYRPAKKEKLETLLQKL